MFILRNLDGGGGGGANPEPSPAPAPTPKVETPTPPPSPPAPPAVNPLAADLAAARARLAELEKADADRAEAARLAEEKKLTEKGEYEKLIKQKDERLAAEAKKAEASEARARSYALNSQLALALAKHDLYEGSAEDLTKLWRDEFEAVPDGEGFVVRAKDGRNVADVIAERLATPRYSNHVKATSRSGSGGGDGHRPAPTPAHDPSKPVKLEDIIAQRMQAANGTHGFGLRGKFGQ